MPTRGDDFRDDFAVSVVYESCLGHGAFGLVLKAVDPAKNNFASAAKFLLVPSNCDEDDPELVGIRREIEIARKSGFRMLSNSYILVQLEFSHF